MKKKENTCVGRGGGGAQIGKKITKKGKETRAGEEGEPNLWSFWLTNF